MGTDDSDGYESDTAMLQLMTTKADIHDNFDTARLNEEAGFFKRVKGKNADTIFA